MNKVQPEYSKSSPTGGLLASGTAPEQQTQPSKNKATPERAGVLAALAAGALALLPLTVHADDTSELAAQTTQLSQEVRAGRAPSPAELNAFGCRGIGGVVFANRYIAFDVFADIPAIVEGDRVTARVIGKLMLGLMPEMLSTAYVEWKLKLNANNMVVLVGNTARPDGTALAVRLKFPYVRGVAVNATMTTSVAVTGETTSETIVCTLR